MEPREKAGQLPESPGVYLFKDAGGAVLYVGKARNLRSRVRSYFLESRWIDAKTGSLAREIADLETILVGNEREALALEHNLIKQYRPKFNVVLRDDKTYPYIKFTAGEKYPRVYFTRRIKKDGSLYFGPYFPASLARRILHFVHKRFLVPSCTVDLTRSHPRPCLQYYIKRCLGPCVAGLTTEERYAEAEYLPKAIHVSADFEDRELLEETLTERAGHKVEIVTPQRGSKRAFLDLVENNAKHSFEQRFRVLKPTSKAIGEALQNALNLAEEPRRIESFDISHIQGTDTVASMVVWENGRMKKADYRKFIIRGEEGGNGKLPRLNDDFSSMREAVTRRYRRLQEEKKELPGLILIDGGIGQLHAAAQALDSLQIINQPVASIAKKEEILYVLGQEDEPIVLERHSPVLHLIQQIRDETHRFAVTFHRQRRGKRQTHTALSEIPGVGAKTAQKLLREFGSVANIQRAGLEELSSVIPRKSAEKILKHLGEAPA